jgi:FixJ family two-component response regulator
LPGQTSAGGSETPLVCIVDDDPSIRDALSGLLRSVRHRVAVFGSCTAFFEDGLARPVGCLIVDIRLPGMSGLEFQSHLLRGGRPIPIVFMTGHGDVEMSVRAMKGGAVDFLEKPFREQDMLDAVTAALERDRRWRTSELAGLAVRQAFESLTAREREVMALVTAGLMNKQIAGEIRLSEVTVKIHRAQVMRKMGARSLADLVRMADLLELASSPAQTGKTGAIL